MLAGLLNMSIVLLTVLAMEWVAFASHKYVMHGALWALHASHHAPRESRQGWFEKNDLFAIGFALPAIVLIWLGTSGVWPLQWIGAGMTLYGLLYFVAHDGLVHRRWPLPMVARRGYLKRLYQAHRLHHTQNGKQDGVLFGFLWAPSEIRLKTEIDEVRAQRSRRSKNAAGAQTL